MFSCSCDTIKDTSGNISTSCAASGPATLTPQCIPPGTPDFLSDSNGDPVNASGHTLFRDWPKSDTLSCSSWSSTGDCLDGNGKTDYDISDPLWATVKYPFLNTIYNYLSGEKGIFRLFKPSLATVSNWDDAGESKITYCTLRDGRASSMLEPYLNYYDPQNENFDKPDARCEDNPATYTKGLSVYPEYIGGVENAKKWVSACALLPNNMRSATCQMSFAPDANPPLDQTGTKDCTGKAGTAYCPVLSYNLDQFKNYTDIIPNELKPVVVSKVKASFPSSIISVDRLVQIEQWAKQNNWSPSFITALWIEETGASASVVSGASNDAFGCVPVYPRKKTFEESLDCLAKNFPRLWKDTPFTFENFMLQYSALNDLLKWRCFCQNPNFPTNIKTIYDFVKNPQQNQL